MTAHNRYRREMLNQLALAGDPLPSRALCRVGEVPAGEVASRLQVLGALVNEHLVERVVTETTKHRRQIVHVSYRLTTYGKAALDAPTPEEVA